MGVMRCRKVIKVVSHGKKLAKFTERDAYACHSCAHEKIVKERKY